VLVVWIKRTHRFARRLANLQAARRRGWRSALNGLPLLSDALRRLSGQHGSAGVVRGQPVLKLVREAVVVKLFANPLVLRAGIAFVAAGGASFLRFG